MVNLLLKHGSDINATNHDGWTPLHFAAEYGNWIKLRKFVHGKSWNGKINLNYIPGRQRAVQILIDNGAGKHIKANGGKEPRDLAIAKGAFKSKFEISFG